MDPTPLVESIRRFAGKFESGTGIHVEIVDGVNGMLMNDRLAAGGLSDDRGSTQ
jgi:hypothetical protein